MYLALFLSKVPHTCGASVHDASSPIVFASQKLFVLDLLRNLVRIEVDAFLNIFIQATAQFQM